VSPGFALRLGFGAVGEGGGAEVEVVVVGAGGAGGAVTTGDVATIVRGLRVLLVSRRATIPAVAEPAATSRRRSDAKTQSPG
jgi:hypothetical protein